MARTGHPLGRVRRRVRPMLLVVPLLLALTAGPGSGLAPSASAAATVETPVGGPLMGTSGVVAPRGAPALPAGVGASGWLVADLDSGEVLAARNPHGRYLPASTLKVLTALTLLPELTDRQRVVTATPDDCNVDGTRVGLVPNGRYTIEMLFQCMLMMSGNDCAHALAAAAGGLPNALAMMNAEAHRLHAEDTHAATPSGLDGPGQSSSAYDLALILREALDNPDFRAYNTTRRGTVPAQPPKYPAFEFANDNLLLRNYPGTIAAKNGYTDAARHTFVAAAQRGETRLVVTLMHGERQPVDMWEQAAALLDWGFALPAGVEPVGELVEPDDPRTAENAGDTGEDGDEPAGQIGEPAAVAPSAESEGAVTRWWPTVLGGVALLAVAVGTTLTLRRMRTPNGP